MGKHRASKDREDSWKKIFKGLIDMIENQQLQLQSLLTQRKSLEKRFESHQQKWVCDINFLQDHISQVKIPN